MRCDLRFVVLLVFTLSPNVWAQSFLPPGVLNPGGTSDSGDDDRVSQVIDGRGMYHVVWESQVDYTGDSGTDWDIYYSRGNASGWTQPVLVNSYGRLDGNDMDGFPRLALGPDGTLHCVWQSQSTFAGAGNDWDIFYSQNSGSGWNGAEIVNDFATGIAAMDRAPSLAVGFDGRVVVAWESNYGLGPFSLGPDKDILYAVRIGGAWTPARWLNSNANNDSGDDLGPVALTTTADGDIVAAWSTGDDFTQPAYSVGTDRDIVFSVLTPGGGWSPITEVTGLAATDTGDDRQPAVLSIGSGNRRELHFVWSSNENLNGAGTDYDILHAVRGPGSLLPPANPAWPVNSTALTDGPFDHDTAPTLCVEPGGVIHCAWESPVDIFTGPDSDIYHSTNATAGSDWSPIDLLGLNGLLDDAAENDYGPSIAVAPNGLLSAVWESRDDLGGPAGGDYDIFHALGASRGISRPQLINIDGDFDIPGSYDGGLALALAPDGTLHAVWDSDNGNMLNGSTGADDDIFHATLGPNGWSAPDLANTNGTTDAGTNNDFDFSPDIAIGEDGTLHVIYSSTTDFGGTMDFDYDLFYTFNDGSGWTAPELVNSKGTQDVNPYWLDHDAEVAVAADGTVHAIWMSDADGSGPPPAASNLSYAYRSAGGWSAEEYVNSGFAASLSSVNNFPDFLLDEGGIPHVVWQSSADVNGAGTDFDIFYSTRTGGAWSAPEFVNDAGNDGSDDRNPTLAMTPDGQLHVVWDSDLAVQGAGADRDLFYARRTGSGWTTAQLLNTLGAVDTGDDETPEMVADEAGDLHIVWVSREGLFLNAAGTDRDIFYTQLPLPAVLPSNLPVVLANPAGYADRTGFPVGFEADPHVIIDHDGYVHFAWESEDSLGGTIGEDWDVLHTRTNLPVRSYTGVSRWRSYR